MRNLRTLKNHLKKQLFYFNSSVNMNEDKICSNWKLNVLPKLQRMKEEAYDKRNKNEAKTMDETKKEKYKQK